jgi:hypothetical protein
MKKIILIYLLLTNLAFGYNYNELLLQAQASIFPKITLLDKKLENKLINGKIVYTIVYDKKDYLVALEIKELIDANCKGKFDKYAYKINLVEFSNVTNQTQVTVFYVLNSSEKEIQRIANFAKEKGIISFSYDENNLKNGLLFSLVLEKSTTLYLNKKYLDIRKVDFVNSLLQMTKYVDEDNS